MLLRIILVLAVVIPALLFSGNRLLWTFSLQTGIKRLNHLISFHMHLFEDDRFFFESNFGFLLKSQDKKKPDDAGDFLNPRFPWALPGASSPLEEKGKEARAPLGLSYLSIERIRLAGEDWPGLSLPTEMNQKGFNWLEQLSGYSYWDIDSSSPRAEALKNGVSYEKLPVPDFRVLKAWIQMYLARSYQRGSVKKAEKTVTGMARLLLSTESRNQVENAFTLLEVLAEFLGYYKLTAIHPVIQNISFEEVRNRYQRMLAYQISTFSMFTRPGAVKKVYGEPYVFPDCISAAAALVAHGNVKAFAVQLRKETEQLEAAAERISKSHCRLKTGWNTLRAPDGPENSQKMLSEPEKRIRNLIKDQKRLINLADTLVLKRVLGKHTEQIKKAYSQVPR